MILQLIQFFSLLFLMLVTGIFWGPWFSLHRSMKVFNKEEFIKIVKIMSSNLALPMRIMMPTCIAFMILSVFLYPQIGYLRFYLVLMALILIIISLLITVIVEVPIVKQIENWSAETIPSNLESIQDKWLKFHVLRTFAAIISFVCYVVSVLI